MRDEIAIFEQAADWAEKGSNLTDKQKQELENWLKEDPAHGCAYQKCVTIWHSENLPHALSLQTRTAPAQTKSTSERMKLTVTFCSLALLLLLSLYGLPQKPSQEQIIAHTQTSELRNVDLPDGSQMKLAGETALNFSFSSTQRKVEIEKGESLFSVQHLADNQPFIVDAGDTQIEVTGTEFSVDKSEYGTQVLVVEGSVIVANGVDNRRLSAGQGVEIIDGEMGSVVNLPEYFSHYLVTEESSSDWLDAYKMSLGFVIAKLDREMAENIDMEDRSLSRIRVSGRFDLKNPRHTLKMLALANKLKVSEYPGQIILRRN